MTTISMSSIQFVLYVMSKILGLALAAAGMFVLLALIGRHRDFSQSKLVLLIVASMVMFVVGFYLFLY